jgi:hypothetical protein
MAEPLLHIFRGMGLPDQAVEGGYFSPYFQYQLSKIHKVNLLWLCNTLHFSSFFATVNFFYTLSNKGARGSIVG